MIEFYPQMSDRCYTDFHLFQICLTSVDYLYHTDGHGWMSASGQLDYCIVDGKKSWRKAHLLISHSPSNKAANTNICKKTQRL